VSAIEKFEADSLTIYELFPGSTYEVPAFQRDYAWTKEQCQDLWTDIGNLLKNESQAHFLGPMVVTQEVTNGDSNYSTSQFTKKFMVIDGQQRLTTLQIILSLIRDRFIEIGGTRETPGGKKEAHELCQSLISGAPSYTLTFVPNLYIRDLFKKIVQEPAEKEKSKPRALSEFADINDKSHSEELLAAYIYFKNEIDAMNREDLFALESALLNRVFVLRIDAGKIGNAFLLFDTLNNRGLDLTQGDLLKNYIFKKTDPTASSVLSPELSRRLSKWDNIVETVGYKKLDTFLRYFLILQKKTKVQRENIITEIEMLYDSKERVGTLIQQLEEEASRFSLIERDSMFDGKNSDELNLLFSDLDDLEQSTQTIFLMAALKRFSEYSKTEVFRNLTIVVRLAELLSFRWLICSKNAQDLENIWTRGVKLLSDGSSGDDEVVEKISTLFKSELPDDKEFQTEFETKVIKSNKFARYILKKIEHHRMSTNTWVLAGSSVLDVEHIAPKTPDDKYDWKEVMQGPNSYKTIVFRIGNLILLSKGPNRAAKNISFQGKLNFYRKQEGNDLPLVSKFVLDEKSWSQAKVVTRCKSLSQEAVNVWSWSTVNNEIKVTSTRKRRRPKKTQPSNKRSRG
jgi:uncharacterized protein with ParB-like and HNH nuclease domain